jgi:Tesmin/TSO1-like CXC domain, cysteine-rich domain
MNSNHRNNATTTKGSGTSTTTTSTTTHRNHNNAAAVAKSNNNSATPSLNNNNNKPSTAMKSKLTIGSGVGTNDSNDVPLPASYLSMAALQTRPNHLNRTKSRALSPTEIEINHRDEIQHMGCTCKKTRCLKLYCQCFAAKLYCGVNCRCAVCFNNRKHEKQRKEAMRNILSRNLSAFDTKFKKDATLVLVEQPVVAPTNPMAGTATTSPPSSDLSKTPDPTATTSNAAVATTTPDATTTAATLVTSTEVARVLAHRLGCKCRKSACMKKVRRAAARWSILPFRFWK